MSKKSMSNLIDRQAVIDAFLTELTKRERKNLLHTWSTVEVKYFVADMLEKMPSAQPERKTGRWIVYKAPDKYHCGLVKCPFCGEDAIAEADEYNYCPGCGADLREEGEQNAD